MQEHLINKQRILSENNAEYNVFGYKMLDYHTSKRKLVIDYLNTLPIGSRITRQDLQNGAKLTKFTAKEYMKKLRKEGVLVIDNMPYHILCKHYNDTLWFRNVPKIEPSFEI